MPSRTPRPRSLFSQLLRLAADDDVRALTRRLLRVVRDVFALADPVPELTYNDTIAYFVNQRPDDPRIVKGALLLVPQRAVIQVYFLFLDEQDTPLCDGDGHLYGRALPVLRLDDELQEAFGGTELLILE